MKRIKSRRKRKRIAKEKEDRNFIMSLMVKDRLVYSIGFAFDKKELEIS